MWRVSTWNAQRNLVVLISLRYPRALQSTVEFLRVGTDANTISRCSRLLLHARANFVPNPACRCSWLTRRWCIWCTSNVGNLVQLGVHRFESACRRAICTTLHRKYIRNQETCRKLRLVHFAHVARLFRFFSNREKKCFARTSRFLIS